MELDEIVRRILLARNTLNDIGVVGVDNAKRVVDIYNHLSETADALWVYAQAQNEKGDEKQDAGNQ